MPLFIPSRHGFHFPNHFPPVPVMTLQLPVLGEIQLGNAEGGLCGGMVFAALDYFHSRLDIPKDTQAPEQGSPLFGYVAQRLVDSFHLPFGVMKYFSWMVSSSTTVEECAREYINLVRNDRFPVPLGLVRKHSLNPVDLATCHQVLAFRITKSGIGIYDPNYPDRDDVCLTFDEVGKSANHSIDGHIHGFFASHYQFNNPENF